MGLRLTVKVWNDNDKVFKCKHDDVEYTIPGHGFIEVSRTLANQMYFQYRPLKIDGVGNVLDPQQLRLEYPVDGDGNTVRFSNRDLQTNKSMLDGKEYPNAEALKAHILANAQKLDNVEAAVKSLKKG